MDALRVVVLEEVTLPQQSGASGLELLLDPASMLLFLPVAGGPTPAQKAQVRCRAVQCRHPPAESMSLGVWRALAARCSTSTQPRCTLNVRQGLHVRLGLGF